MELFEQIRREYRFGVGTIRGVAKQFGVHRRIVRQAMASAVPPHRKVPMRSQPKLEPVKEFIDEILQADQQAPRKQRHTAHRIWQRIGAERSEVRVAESTVRHYVCCRKQELGMTERETFVPQSYDWGSEGQVDWYEAFAEVMGESRKVYCFAMLVLLIFWVSRRGDLPINTLGEGRTSGPAGRTFQVVTAKAIWRSRTR